MAIPIVRKWGYLGLRRLATSSGVFGRCQAMLMLFRRCRISVADRVRERGSGAGHRSARELAVHTALGTEWSPSGKDGSHSIVTA